MREVLVGVQVLGGILAVYGAYRLAAAPLPGYRWFNRVAVMALMGALFCWPAVLGVIAVIRAAPSPALLCVSLFTLVFGGGLLFMVRQYLRVKVFRTMLEEGRESGQAPWFMAMGMAIQVVPAAFIGLLALFGIDL
jgi:hypothetical protein